ncbi:hypothetical protein [uncultured Maricaulis sp.]|uniref:hypothetical protein n=1 Tax=uncultured Maricaulis sp. TaxID=174710 RepID=UPI0030D85330|tara:strand:- start:66319 stop:67329 length:1011 start_codon:yes stop_codon:yes gene_type:complete
MRVWIRGAIAVAVALAAFIAADTALHATGSSGFTPSALELTERAARWGEAPVIALGLSYWARSKTSDPDLLFSGQQTRARAWRDLGFFGPAADLMRETVLRAPTDNTVSEASYVFVQANDLDAARELTELVTGRQAPRLAQPDLAVSVYLSMLVSRGRNVEAIAVVENLDTIRWSGSAKRRLDELKLYIYLAAQRPDAVLDWLREPAPAYCLEVRECAASRQVSEAQAQAMLGECDRADATLTELVDQLRAEPFRENIDDVLGADGAPWMSTISTSGQWECRALGMLGQREEAVDACLQDSGTNPSTATAASREYAEYGVPPRLACVPGGTAGSPF